ncbi:hypothetical protein Tco_0480396 [Tanacetum coccineum]
MSEAKTTKEIDWSDPSVQRYHVLKNKPKTVAQARKNMVTYLKNQGNYRIKDFEGMSYDEIRPIFEKVWNYNQAFLAKDSEEVQKEEVEAEKYKKDDISEKIVKEVSKKSGGKRKKTLARKRTKDTASEETSKKQKMEEDVEKEDLKFYLDIVPQDDVAIDVVSLSTRYPIVDWKTYILSETYMYYQVFRADGSSKNYKILSEMLEDFDRQDVVDLFRLVKERYKDTRHEGYDLMLWGDLYTLFEPDEENVIWKN